VACGLEATIGEEADNVNNYDAEDKSSELTLALEKVVHGSLPQWLAISYPLILSQAELAGNNKKRGV